MTTYRILKFFSLFIFLSPSASFAADSTELPAVAATQDSSAELSDLAGNFFRMASRDLQQAGNSSRKEASHHQGGDLSAMSRAEYIELLNPHRGVKLNFSATHPDTEDPVIRAGRLTVGVWPSRLAIYLDYPDGYGTTGMGVAETIPSHEVQWLISELDVEHVDVRTLAAAADQLRSSLRAADQQITAKEQSHTHADRRTEQRRRETAALERLLDRVTGRRFDDLTRRWQAATPEHTARVEAKLEHVILGPPERRFIATSTSVQLMRPTYLSAYAPLLGSAARIAKCHLLSRGLQLITQHLQHEAAPNPR